MSWTTVKLGEVITHRKEFITISDTVEYKRCRVQVNRKGVVLRDSVKGIQINTKKQQVCKEGDFLVAEIDAKVGGYGFVPADLDGAIVSSHYFLFEVDETKMLKSYLAWIIKTDIIQEQISSKGSTNYAAIRPSHVLNFEIPLPSLAEQNELIKKLDSFYKGYEMIQAELQKQENYLTLLRQSILQEAVQGKLVPQDANAEPAEQLLQRIKAEKSRLIKQGKLKNEKELPPITEAEIPFALPEGWVWCRYSEIAELQHGYQFRQHDFVSNGIPVVKITQCKSDGTLDLSKCDFIDKSRETEFADIVIKKDDLLMALTGGTLGKVTRVDKDYGTIVQNYRVGKFIPKTTFITKDFLTIILQSTLFQNLVKGRINQNAQPNVGKEDIEQLMIPLPSISEQIRIASKVTYLNKILKIMEEQVQQSKKLSQQLLQTILQEAFTGRQKEYAENEMLTMAAEE